MTTKFTKDYIEQRIEARKVKLVRELNELDDLRREWEENRKGLLVERIRENTNNFHHAWVGMASAQDELEELLDSDRPYTFDDLNILIRAQHRAIPEFKNAPIRPTARVANHYGGDDRTPIERKAEETRNHREELNKLDHALAYFKESPVTEFTVSSLKDLGLLAAVRFSIEPDKKK